MRRLRLLALAVGVLAVSGLAFAGTLYRSSTTSSTSDAGAEEILFERMNNERTSVGIAPYVHDQELTEIARRWSQRMADEGRLFHNDNLKQEVKQDWESLAENVAFGQEANKIHEAFMRSEGHRKNILDSRLTHAGVGVVVVDRQMWVTEVFMRLRKGKAAAPPPAPTQPPPPTTPPAPRPTRPARTPPTTAACSG